MQRASLAFRDAPGGNDDRFQLRIGVPMPLDAFDIANEAFTLTLSDSDGTIYSATVPAGSFTYHGARRRRYFDRTGTLVPGLRKVTVRVGKAGVTVRAVGHNLDLGNANQVDITATLHFGEEAFQTTNQFRAQRSELRFP